MAKFMKRCSWASNSTQQSANPGGMRDGQGSRGSGRKPLQLCLNLPPRLQSAVYFARMSDTRPNRMCSVVRSLMLHWGGIKRKGADMVRCHVQQLDPIILV